MTETQWLAGDLKKLLKFLHRNGSERKRRLFACACCRRAWRLFIGPQCIEALDVAERYADGRATPDELSEAEVLAQEAYATCRELGEPANMVAADAVYGATCAGVGWDTAEFAAERAANAVSTAAGAPHSRRKAAKAAEVAAQLALLRDIFGNPFRPVAFNPAWRTSDVALLATGIYDEKGFDRLPILADALQDAGCDAEELLAHLRDGTAVHVRGCWALDLALDKE